MAARHPGRADEQDDMARNLSSASSALQGLLRKLGGGFDEGFMTMGVMAGGRFKNVIADLKQADDESSQLGALTELCELLAVSSEDHLASFPTETAVPLLVQSLNAEHNPDIMLLAARALTFLADMMPQACGSIVRHGAVASFCQRLLTIEYIDLAEQSLLALEKLSHDHAPALLQQGGLMAVLSYLDFFPTGVQRVAVTTAASMCAGLGVDAAPMVREAVPILTNLLQYQDARVVNSACLALSNIAESYAAKPQLLSMLETGGLITQALQLVALSEGGAPTSQLSLTTYYSLLKLMATMSAKSAAVAQQLLAGGLLPVVYTLLATSSLLPGGGSDAAPGALRSPDQLAEVMSLLCELLPPVPAPVAAVEDGLPVLVGTAQQQGGDDPRAQHFAGHADATQLACRQLLPLVLQLHSAAVIPHVRQLCLSSLLRLLAMGPPAELQQGLRGAHVATLLAALLASTDGSNAAMGLVMCEVLVAKLPAVFKPRFLKGGVVQALQKLAGSSMETRDAPVAAQAASPSHAPPATTPEPAAKPGDEPSRRVTRSTSRQPTPTAGGPSTRNATLGAAPATAAGGAPTPGRSPAAADAGATRDPLATALAARAAAFCSTHFADATRTADGLLETPGLARLRDLAGLLRTTPGAMAQLVQLLAGAPLQRSGASGSTGQASVADVPECQAVDDDDDRDVVSVFEIVHSGAVRALADYLRGRDLDEGPAPQAAHLARLRAFVNVALAADTGERPLMVAVVRRLQAALASVETFPVLLSRVSTPSAPGGLSGAAGARPGASRPGIASGSAAGGAAAAATAAGSLGGSYRSGLAALARPFKLRLVRAANERQLRDYASNVVLIEPLATMSTIEDFLYPRVYQPGAASAPAAAAAAGGAATRGDGNVGGSSGGGGTAGAAGAKSASAGGSGAAPDAGGSRPGAPAPLCGPRSKARPIPEPPGGTTRRMTRAAAARARAASGPDAALPGDPGDAYDSDFEQAMDDHDDDGLDGGADLGLGPDFDGEEELDEEFDGQEDGDGELDVGAMHVHDLHVDEAPGGEGPLAARSRSQPAAATPPAGGTMPGRLAPTLSEGAAAAARGAAAGGRPPQPSPWGGRGRGSGAAAAGGAGDPAPPGPPASVLSEQPRLVFYSGQQKLAPSATVFQAVQQLAMARASGADDIGPGGSGSSAFGAGRDAWDGIYTLHYRSADASDAVLPGGGPHWPAAPASGRNAAATAPAGADDGDADGAALFALPVVSTAMLPLGAVLALRAVRGVELPEGLDADAHCRDVLLLISVLEAINRTGARLCAAAEQEAAAAAAGVVGPSSGRTADGADSAPVYGHAPRQELVSSKLTSKLSQQLKDVLTICGGGLPAWCSQLVFTCRHLLSFDIRRRYFYCTALGLGRALQHIQTLHSNEVGGAPGPAGGAAEREAREMRVGRLHRQKVRVSRKRILESAAKVMELYASHRAVLELEYFGEVGTGLGPTLEFYTLLSHDLQRRALRLWRHEDLGLPTGIVTQPSLGEADRCSGGSGAGGLPTPRTGSGVLERQGSRPRVLSCAAGEGPEGGEDVEYVNAPWGLFPSPLPPSQRGDTKVLDLFKLLGRAMAKALQDNRLMDLPMAYAFYRAALGQPLDLYDISAFDPALGQQLQRLWLALVAARGPGSKSGAVAPAPPPPTAKPAAARRRTSSSSSKAAAGAAGAPTVVHVGPAGGAQEGPSAARPILVDGVPVEDLCLTFVVPGYPDFELVPGGADQVVDSASLGQWIAGVVDATVGAGIAAQLHAFRAGFNEVFPLSALACFYEDELETLLCGAGEAWAVPALAAAIKFDHGYSPSSPVVLALLEVLSELDAAQQRAFLRFVTGCPRLPPGGLAALQPRLTVVRKHPSGDKNGSVGGTPVGSLRAAQDVPPGHGTTLADGDLPSVMTCANYIKLPPYSNKATLRERLLYAISEGQGSFDLS